MINGDSILIGYINEYDLCNLTQGVIILPNPSHDSLYYIFQMQDEGMKYSLVQIENSDSGSVIEKNIDFHNDNVREKMLAVKHANGRDWWLLMRKFPLDYELESPLIFVKFLITPSSINGPFEQEYGPNYEFYDGYFGVGQMKFSLDG
jgi:hypothetical protein